LLSSRIHDHLLLGNWVYFETIYRKLRFRYSYKPQHCDSLRVHLHQRLSLSLDLLPYSHIIRNGNFHLNHIQGNSTTTMETLPPFQGGLSPRDCYLCLRCLVSIINIVVVNTAPANASNAFHGFHRVLHAILIERLVFRIKRAMIDPTLEK